LAAAGNDNEANAVLNSLKKQIADIEKVYGKNVINYSKLPDYLKK